MSVYCRMSLRTITVCTTCLYVCSTLLLLCTMCAACNSIPPTTLVHLPLVHRKVCAMCIPINWASIEAAFGRRRSSFLLLVLSCCFCTGLVANPSVGSKIGIKNSHRFLYRVESVQYRTTTTAEVVLRTPRVKSRNSLRDVCTTRALPGKK